MFEAAEAVMRQEMVMGGWILGSGGLEAVMVVFGGSACSMASQASGITIHSCHWASAERLAVAQSRQSKL